MTRRLTLRFEDPEVFGHEYRQNIVQGGAFIPSLESWEMRETVAVELELAWCGERAELEGEIVHWLTSEQAGDPSAAGVAVQFQTPALELRERFERFVAHESASHEASDENAEVDTSDLADALSDFEPGTNPSEASDDSSLLGFETNDVEPPLGLETNDVEPPALGFDRDDVEPPEFESDLLGESDLEAPREEAAQPSGGGIDPTEHDDRRGKQRGAARVPARLDASHVSLEGRTRDISESGVLVSMDGSDLPLGKEVRLGLVHPETGEELDVKGRVVRHIEAEGTVAAVGVEFEPGRDTKVRLGDFVRDAHASERDRREAGIAGVIEEIGMANLLQMFGKSSQQGTLTVTSGSEEGVVAFESGLLRYARLGSLKGTKALARLMRWTEGSFAFHAQVDAMTEEGDAIPLDGAILEAVRQIDEVERMEMKEVDLGATLRLDSAALQSFGEPLGKTESAVADLAAAGLTIRRLLDVIPESDADVLQALRELVEGGIVKVDHPGDD
ncbi:MAG: PilZ domain-containing protein [Myxococcota bacterium]